MKTVVVLFTVLLATAALAAPPLPSGTYAGTGHWRGPQGTSGTYSVETVVTGDTLTSRYVYDVNGAQRRETVTMTLSEGQEPFFDVRDGSGQVIGSGYRFDSRCAYRLDVHGMVVEETIESGRDGLVKFGAKKGPDFRVVWTETLTAR